MFIYILMNYKMEKFIKDKIFDIKDEKETKEELEIKEFKIAAVKLQTELKKFPNNEIEYGRNTVSYLTWIAKMSDNVSIKWQELRYEFNQWWIHFLFVDKITNSSVRFQLSSRLELDEFTAIKMAGKKADYEISYYRERAWHWWLSSIRKDKWWEDRKDDSGARAEAKQYIDTMLDIIERYKKTEKAKVELKKLKAEIKK